MILGLRLGLGWQAAWCAVSQLVPWLRSLASGYVVPPASWPSVHHPLLIESGACQCLPEEAS